MRENGERKSKTKPVISASCGGSTCSAVTQRRNATLQSL